MDAAIETAWPEFIASLQAYIKDGSLKAHKPSVRHFQKGQLSQDADEQECRRYTLSYAMMHAIALSNLLEQELVNTQCINNHSAILHIDFACGPGSALWALLRLAKQCSWQHLTSLGYDHNPHILKLAMDISDTITPQIPANFEVDESFLDDRAHFNQLIRVKSFFIAGRVKPERLKYDVVLVTINSLFGQKSFQKNDPGQLIETIKPLKKVSRKIPVLIVGTHPDYGKIRLYLNTILEYREVQHYFNMICQDLNGEYLYNGKIGSSWIPGGIEPTDTKPQLAHIIKL